ncbi:hypothetical protein ACHAXR_009298 [Thalassiosira sp. AJA248-18]
MTMTKKWPRDYGEGHNIGEIVDDASAADGSLTSTAVDHNLDPRCPSSLGQSPMRSHVNTDEVKISSSSSWPVALYIPNLLGYLRIVLSFYGLKHALRQHPHKALNIWITAALLDLFDGVAARWLNQCSQFGIFLDIAADNILRTIVWISAIIETSKSQPTTGENEICVWAAIICLEWVTMFCSQNNKTNQQGDQHIHWKDVKRKVADTGSNRPPPPFWVQAVFKDNFRSLPGIFAIYGLFAAPFGTYVWYADREQKSTWPARLISENIMTILLKISYAGRLLSAMVELWLCYEFLSCVITRDRRQKLKPKDS